MPDIVHQFPIKAPLEEVFKAVSTPAGLDAWWTLTSLGKAARGEVYELGFGPEYDWRASVSKCTPYSEFELKITHAQDDWLNTVIGFQLKEKNGAAEVLFYHKGWPENNDHYRISSYCWAMYLRLMKRYVENGEVVEYSNRLDA